jgi:hypothetical protein
MKGGRSQTSRDKFGRSPTARTADLETRQKLGWCPAGRGKTALEPADNPSLTPEISKRQQSDT